MLKVCDKDIKIEGRLIRIARPDGDKYNFPDDPEAMLDGLRVSGMRIDLFTFLQKVSETSPKYAYPMEWDNLAVLPVSSFETWWTKQVDNKTRNMVRKAEKKGVKTREIAFGETVIRGICEIYTECPIRLGKRFPHYGMSFERAREYAGTYRDRSTFIGAFIGETMIGFTKVVTDEARNQACMVHILVMIRHKDKAVTNSLIAEAVRFCAERGISYLVYEHFAYGKKRSDSLSHFKEVNGFHRVDLPRYYVPLTFTGSVALQLGMHHRFRDHLPESVAAKLRELRNSWYTDRLRSSTGGL